MSVTVEAGLVRLHDPSRVEDAEALLTHLQQQPDCLVDLGQATHLHAAVVQLLLAFRPPLVALPGDPFLLAFLTPLLVQDGP
jgi:hypothetical protein